MIPRLLILVVFHPLFPIDWPPPPQADPPARPPAYERSEPTEI